MTEPGADDAVAIVPVGPADDEPLARIVRAGMAEHGVCRGTDGDPGIEAISRAFAGPRAAYFVARRGARVLGGGGIGPVPGGPDDICELRTMYLDPEARGAGTGRRLLAACLEAARAAGYRTCRLATRTGMERARRLYERAGFRPVETPIPGTGEAGCDRWYEIAL